MVSTEKVELDLVLPLSDQDLNLQVSQFEESMKKVAGDTGFERLDWQGAIDDYDEKRKIVRRLIFNFEQEKRRAGRSRR